MAGAVATISALAACRRVVWSDHLVGQALRRALGHFVRQPDPYERFEGLGQEIQIGVDRRNTAVIERIEMLIREIQTSIAFQEGAENLLQTRRNDILAQRTRFVIASGDTTKAMFSKRVSAWWFSPYFRTQLKLVDADLHQLQLDRDILPAFLERDRGELEVLKNWLEIRRVCHEQVTLPGVRSSNATGGQLGSSLQDVIRSAR